LGGPEKKEKSFPVNNKKEDGHRKKNRSKKPFAKAKGTGSVSIFGRGGERGVFKPEKKKKMRRAIENVGSKEESSPKKGSLHIINTRSRGRREFTSSGIV